MTKPCPGPMRSALLLAGIVALAACGGEAAAPAQQTSEVRACNGRNKDCVAPSLSVTSPNADASVSGTVAVAGTAADDVAVSKVEVAVDAGAFQVASGTTSWSFPLDTRALPDGAHALAVRATDGAGNRTTTSVPFTSTNAVSSPTTPPPNAPPSVWIDAPASGATVSGSIAVSGRASDDAGVARVELSVDGGAWTLASGTSAWSSSVDTLTLANGTHTIAARATDSAGAQTTTSVSLSVSNAPPPAGLAVAITAPSNGATVSGKVTVTGTSAGASRVQVRFDAMAYLDVPPGPTWSYTFDSVALANGAHTLVARALDASGTAVTTQIGFTTSNVNTPPNVVFAAPAAGSNVSGLVEVSGFMSDLNGAGQVQLSVDGGAYVYTTGFGRFTYDLDTSKLTNGTHTLVALATDDLGATSTATRSFVVSNSDVVAPRVTVTSPASAATVSGTLTVTGTASDNIGLARVEVKESNAAYSAATGTSGWSLSLDTRGLSNGSHTFVARAVDTTGNVATTSFTVTVANGYSKESLVTPEGIHIYVDSASGFSAAEVYRILKDNARDLALVGPTLTVRVGDGTGSSEQTSCSSTNGCSAIINLDGGPTSGFSRRPDEVIAHEYGHAWSLYHLNVTHAGDWSAYLVARGLDADPRLDSVYPTFDRREDIAEDYRELFGSASARGWANRMLAHPLTVPGLQQFLATGW
ncbi:Ig-like domain-containing protein [Anaeromyxobacter terrae]|uniref:Ig-like domain-containing protein n=1 Tax=Anaeromyxobacter terrae TaxID=2925406 RepID=UPI001F582542|nr:Ig-like domain-containing protein [Anaeromyxobacter sp. SG22]